MAETLSLRGTLEGHAGWVTAIAAPLDPASDVLISASRDKSLIVWTLTREDGAYGAPRRALRGHSHFVQDVVLSSDGQFALSGSWDGTLRLWDLAAGATTRRFLGHTKDVLSVAFSVDNRQIVSGSRDRTIKLWNTIGVGSMEEGRAREGMGAAGPRTASPVPPPRPRPPPRPPTPPLHRRSASTRSASPTATPSGCRASASRPRRPTRSSCPPAGTSWSRSAGWGRVWGGGDGKTEKPRSRRAWGGSVPRRSAAADPPPPPRPTPQVWNLANCKLRFNLVEHTGYVASVTVSPDGSLCASGGKDGVARLWDLSEGKRLYSLDAGDAVQCLAFSPNRYWLVAATMSCVKIWDLESKSTVVELRPEFPPASKKAQTPHCVSLAWSADGATLYTGYTDGVIRVWGVNRAV